jgi:hypothetical protein
VEQDWLFWADVAAGAVGCLGLWVRRRWPVGLALVLIGLSTFSEFVAGAMVLAMLTVAIHRPPRTTAWVFGLSVLAALVYVVVRPEPGVDAMVLFLIGVIVQAAAVGWGLFIHYRRQLVLSLRDRAERAETEAQLRAEQAQQRARDEIAREMHDVLGHRLSLLSVHAGALEFRPDAPAGEVARAAKVIRENATRPSRTCVRSSASCAPRRRAAPADPGRRPAADGRVGPGRDAGVPARRGRPPRARPDRPHRLPGRAGGPDQRPQARPRRRGPCPPGRFPGAGLTVEVRNEPPRPGPPSAPHPDPPLPGPPSAPHPDPPLPGPPVGERSPTASSGPAVIHSPSPAAGQGLVGLTERVTLASGRLEYGPAAGGGWCLRVWLPWPP